MKTLNIGMSLLARAFYGKTGRLIVLALTITLFVLSASAPNATIGIGK